MPKQMSLPISTPINQQIPIKTDLSGAPRKRNLAGSYQLVRLLITVLLLLITDFLLLITVFLLLITVFLLLIIVFPPLFTVFPPLFTPLVSII